jgi:hypothetical protein
MDAAIQPRSHPLDDISRDCQLPLATANGSVSGGAARSVSDKMKNLGILSLTEVVYWLIQSEQKVSDLKQNLCGGLMIRRPGSQS